jgi:hypothetical protein
LRYHCALNDQEELLPGIIEKLPFDFPTEDLDGLALDDPFAELGGHLLSVVGVEIQLVADLLVREIQSHEIKTEDPDPQRLVMASEDRTSQVVEEFLTGLATVALPLRLGRIMTLFRNPQRVAMGASHALGPAQLANRFVTLPVVDEILDVDHRP